ncbi:MAG TPA: family 78 glycoside hydrolase catalytic domain [Chloroflexota bacterium]|nr:family 78 glycoside hydrolase catalytic domain [Chloroflexota bacterium]
MIGAVVCTALPASEGPCARDLKCEYLVNPQGIDVTNPRLSWVLESAERGTVQTAYHILVSGSEDALAHDRGDLWDSGKVGTDQSIHVVYAGRPLPSQRRCFWKVRVWDRHGNVSKWSKPAQWSMGLLNRLDWKGKWIGLDEGENSDYFAQAQWIWSPDESADTAAATRLFRRTVDIPDGREISGARLTIATRGQFAIWVNGAQVVAAARTVFAPVSEIDLEKYLSPGVNTVAVAASATGKKEDPSGLICALSAEFESGEPLVIVSDASWRVSSRETNGWERPGFDDSRWASAKELGGNGVPPFANVAGDEYRRLPARMLRRELQVDRKIKRATVYMCGLGLSELYINGRRIGDHVLSPGLTDYNKRSLYVTYDVAKDLRQGTNAVGVVLGNGRYFAPRRSSPTTTVSYGYPKLLFQIQTEYEDGSVSTVVSDESWKITDSGPIRANNEYDGEVYDARKEMNGWSEAGFEDSSWRTASIVDAPKGVLSSEMAEPIRVMEKLRPIAVTSPSPGVHIFDMGQNMVGWCRLKVKGPRGTRVSMKHAERLNPDGTLYLANIRSAKATDTYILRGGGGEVYEPRFTYHGFRYVEITGLPYEPDLLTLEGMVIHDALQRTGEFSCSNQLLNRIYQNSCWGIRGNYRSIPTDCPQRDERQGWFGDRAQVSRGEMYIFDVAALYTKWIRDMEDSQLPDGSIPDIAPAFWPFYTNSITFPTAALAIPDHLYQLYGDLRILETHYQSAKGWVDKASERLTGDTMPRDTYGDWCVPPESLEMILSSDPNRVTDPELVSTAYFHYDLRLIARWAALLGRKEDAARYGDLADRVKTAFNRKFFNETTGIYGNGTQTSSVLALAYNLVPEEHKERVVANLVENVLVKSDCHIGTGMVGCQWLMRALSDNGRPDVAYKLASQTTYPSWGYMVEQGATTIWELWNGDRGDPLMNSGNHVMQIGDLCTWLHEYVAGIAPDSRCPGFKRVVMRPCITAGLTSARAYHKSMYGRIASDWKIADGTFSWRIEIPANTTGAIYVPAKDAELVAEGGRPAKGATGVRFLRMEDGRAIFEVGSGRYLFTSQVDLPRRGSQGNVH